MYIDLIRHGAVEGKDCFRGITDTPLSKRGWQQMLKAVEKLTPKTIISSPLNRCVDFATDWADKSSIPLEIHPSLSEMNFGVWDGKTVEEVQSFDLQGLELFWSDPFSYTAENAESLENFQQRVNNFFLATINTYCQSDTSADADNTIALITHGGVIKSIVAYVLDIPDDKYLSIETSLAKITRIRVSKYQDKIYTSLVFHAGHLE